jgi:hypothetical protein
MNLEILVLQNEVDLLLESLKDPKTQISFVEYYSLIQHSININNYEMTMYLIDWYPYIRHNRLFARTMLDLVESVIYYVINCNALGLFKLLYIKYEDLLKLVKKSLIYFLVQDSANDYLREIPLERGFITVDILYSAIRNASVDVFCYLYYYTIIEDKRSLYNLCLTYENYPCFWYLWKTEKYPLNWLSHNNINLLLSQKIITEIEYLEAKVALM